MAALLVPPPAHAEPVALSADEYKKALRKVVLRIFEKSDLDKNGYITQVQMSKLFHCFFSNARFSSGRMCLTLAKQS